MTSQAGGQDIHGGARSDTGMAGSVQTPANKNVGKDKPGLFDEQGAIGKHFTRESRPDFTFLFSVSIRRRWEQLSQLT